MAKHFLSIFLFVSVLLTPITGFIDSKVYNTKFFDYTLVREEIVKDALHYLGINYLYGGSTVNGFDCSGFASFVMKKHGIDVGRQLSDIEKKFKKTEHPLPGDLVIFYCPNHVGIYIGENKIVHASTSLGITITNLDEEYYKKRFIAFLSIF
jgi:cell wall-associated NlpC family hydrolase